MNKNINYEENILWKCKAIFHTNDFADTRLTKVVTNSL